MTNGTQTADENPIPQVPGSVYTRSQNGFTETYDALVAAIEANPNIKVVATVDHSAAAAGVDLDINPNRVIFFGNPNAGTPLMQADQRIGLDLPQKLHVIESAGETFVGYNSPGLFLARHSLDALPILEKIAGALANLTAAGAGQNAPSHTKDLPAFGDDGGLQSTPSDADIDETHRRLLAAIEGSPANVAFELDHQANAARVDLELRPTRLVVFGNPSVGTTLMQANYTAGIDLPMKMLLWENEEGRVIVTTNTTAYLQQRHGLDGVDLSKVDGALGNFTRAATGG